MEKRFEAGGPHIPPRVCSCNGIYLSFDEQIEFEE